MDCKIRPFSGDFIKHKRYTAYHEVIKAGYSVPFDEEQYQKACDDIAMLLGKKKRYYIGDAMFYFQQKYQAFRIPWEYSSWYEEPDLDIIYSEEEHLDPDSMRPFDYSEKSVEQNITLVIDTVFNEALRKRYPEIEMLEKKRVTKGEGKVPRCNPIIVIGYRKSKVINSMFLANNFNQISDPRCPRPNIPDIPYEMWFFYNHS